MQAGTVVTLGLPNIQYVASDIDARCGFIEYEVHPDSKEYVEAVAQAHPDWTFTGAYANKKRNSLQPNDIEEGVAQVRNFRVTCKGEELGQIFIEYGSRRYEKQYCVRNFRVSAKRQRGDCAKTKDLKKALRTIDKEFKPRDIIEHADAGWQELRARMQIDTDEVIRKFHLGWDRFAELIAPKVMERWEELARELCGDAKWSHWHREENKLKDLVGMYEAANKAKEYQKNFMLVCVHEGAYAVKGAQHDSDICIYHEDDLPENLKCGIGILKLVDPNTFIDGVGMRSKDGMTFAVIPRDEL